MKEDLTNLPIIWINLDKDTDRRAFMEKQLLGRDHHRIRAVSTQEVISYINTVPQFILDESITPLACITSHFLALSYMIQKGWPVAIILEDDTMLSCHKIVAKALTLIPKKWSILQLFTSNVQFYEENAKKTKKWVKWRIDNSSTGAYIIKKSAAKYALKQYFKNGQVNFSAFADYSYLVVADILILDAGLCYTASTPLAYEVEFASNFNTDHEEYSKKTRQYLANNGFIDH